MTTALVAQDIANQLNANYPGVNTEVNNNAVIIDSKSLLSLMTYLKITPGLDFNYLTTITAIDYYQQFEVVYLLVSMEHNQSLTVKTRCNREDPVLPSVTSLWRSADLQEREIYDLMGITFEGHPNMKRLVLWPEFQGHPQRRDYLQ
ncbi:MAG: NADH-quinone oxidoreductase subunit C [Dehalococcoidales bacterium]|nr:NADH-quinone oxidoreductase subunit C [Dehalococcoidales bacterium]